MPTRREFLIQTAIASIAAAEATQIAQSAGKDKMARPTTGLKTYQVPRSDLVVSRLAYGIGMLGVSWRTPDFVAQSVRAIHTAFDNGITFFDTADVYAEGQSEAALGELLKHSQGFRDKIVIQSKCGMRVRAGWAPGDPLTPDSLSVDLSRDHIVSAAEGSLKRLNTDRLDILLLHSPYALVEPQEVAQAFDELNGSGKVRYFGVCMHSAVQVELLKKYVRQPLVVHQIWLSLARYSPIAEYSGFGAIVDYCRVHEMQVQAFSPLKGDKIFEPPLLLNPTADACPGIHQLAQLLTDEARRFNATPAAVMLAWLQRHPAGIVPIGAGCRRKQSQAHHRELRRGAH
jgi:predicted oxidoreductase